MLTRTRTTFFSTLLLLISTSLLLIILFKKILKHPGNYLFGSGGDALKNYYTYLYYSLYDSGNHFTGMNYPFGEHVIFTDSQPLLSYLTNQLNYLHSLSPSTIIGIMNFCMLSGLLAGAFFIYLILRKNLLPGWYAIIAANLIVFLNPQIMRLQNHYALSYCFIVPATWYFLIRIFEDRKNPAWYIVYVVFGLLTGFIHPYYLMIGAFLTLAYTLVYLLQEAGRLKRHTWFLVRLFITAIAPIILFQLWLHFTDNISDRPKTPYGFLVYRSNFESVFFPTEYNFQAFWREIFHTKEPIWEGFAYVGMLGLVVLLFTIIQIATYTVRLRIKTIFRPVLPIPLRIGLWAAVLTLLFSMGIPFTFNLEKLLDYIPPLKQFRSIGRFAWIFYYIFSVYIAFYFYRLYRYLKLKNAWKFSLGFLLIVFLVWGIDAKINVQRKAKEMNEAETAGNFVNENGNYTELLAKANHKPSDFQAILPFPYYLVGSEYFDIVRSGFSLYESQRASVNLHLPIATGMMSRTSFSQTMQLAQLLSSDLIYKPILNKYPNQKPILFLVTNEGLLPEEQNIVSKAEFITKTDRISLYQLPLNALQPDLSAKILEFNQKKASLFEKSGFYTSTPNATIVMKNFAESSSEPGLFDPGAVFNPNGNLDLYNAPLPGNPDTSTYEVSVWWQMNPSRWFSTLKIKLYDKNGMLLEEKTQPYRQLTDIYENWSRASLDIKLQHATDRLEIFLESEGGRADNLLIRPKNTDVYFYTNRGQNLVFNNYLLK